MMVIIKNLNLINVKPWTYLEMTVCEDLSYKTFPGKVASEPPAVS